MTFIGSFISAGGALAATRMALPHMAQGARGDRLVCGTGHSGSTLLKRLPLKRPRTGMRTAA